MELRDRTLTDGQARWELPEHLSASLSVIDADHPDHPAHGLDPGDFDGGGPWPTVTRIELSEAVTLKSLGAPRGFRRQVVEMSPGVLVSGRVAGEERPAPDAEKSPGRWLYPRSGHGRGVYGLRFVLALFSVLPSVAVIEAVDGLSIPDSAAGRIAVAIVFLGSGVVMDSISGWHARQRPWVRRLVWLGPSAAIILLAALFGLR